MTVELVKTLGTVVVTLGTVTISRRAMAILDQYQAAHAVMRHASGDWGDVCDEKWQENEDALRKGHQTVIYSTYLNRDLDRFYVVTEADRNTTTILLPSEL